MVVVWGYKNHIFKNENMGICLMEEYTNTIHPNKKVSLWVEKKMILIYWYLFFCCSFPLDYLTPTGEHSTAKLLFEIFGPNPRGSPVYSIPDDLRINYN